MMTPSTLSLKHAAIYEAGHALAFIRLYGRHHGPVTLLPEPEAETRASTPEPGGDPSGDRLAAEAQVLVALAGYAALIAARETEDTAARGAEQDFQAARQAITQGLPGGDFAQWCAQAIEMMSAANNLKAVECIASELLFRQTLSDQLLAVLVEFADGEITAEDYQRFLLASGLVA